MYKLPHAIDRSSLLKLRTFPALVSALGAAVVIAQLSLGGRAHAEEVIDEPLPEPSLNQGQAKNAEPGPAAASVKAAENIDLSQPVIASSSPEPLDTKASNSVSNTAPVNTKPVGTGSDAQTNPQAEPLASALPSPRSSTAVSIQQELEQNTEAGASGEVQQTKSGAAAAKKPSEAGEAANKQQAAQPASEQEESSEKAQQDWLFLNTLIPPATTTRLSWAADQGFEGIATPTPVLVAHGASPGPKLCLTAAVHGDELNGIEIVRRLMYSIDASALRGTVIGVPIVNLQGFVRSSRYLTDRRDLNRFFPGNPQGSSAARIAHSFFSQVIRHCDMLVDLHTGSFYRTNLPQLRANIKDKKVLELSSSFDDIAVLHSEGGPGTLRRAAVDIGIPAVTLEAGGPMELNESDVAKGVKAINTLLDRRDMLDTLSFWGAPQPTYYGSLWVRADQGGILFSEIKLGAKVKEGQLLGRVTDPITNIHQDILSPIDGRILGMALNQVVQPGFAAYHIGMQAAADEVEQLPPQTQEPQDEHEENAIDYD
ncbi:M14 family metallopeptidase [Agaribacterium haliotis]|uniref:M14 family metallopeptidase n=1 Tax=Agaribacterium haliotis TaxID=2013869 RepID=UPI000BB56BE9|nr:succinylglutamate desuccinylase/aspartoacylase family protein [Agaribacterium haliotis]